MDTGTVLVTLALITSLLNIYYLRFCHPGFFKRSWNPARSIPLNRGGHSCKYCQHFIVPWPKNYRDNYGFNYRLPLTPWQVRKAAIDGCEFLSILTFETKVDSKLVLDAYTHLFKAIFKPGGWYTEVAGLESRLRRWQYFLGALGPFPYILHFYPFPSDTAFQTQSFPRFRPLFLDRAGHPRHVFTEEDNSMADYIPTRPVNTDVASPESFARARQWLRDCLNAGSEHQNCGSAPPANNLVVPARLLDVGTDALESPVRLYSPSISERIRWCSLSYCWGGDQPAKLTKGRLNTYSQRISLDSLPKTIRDAVRVTREMNLRYCWIDSLCIIQDSKEDRDIELSKMTHIFRNSLFTISASSAASSCDGFLQVREEPLHMRRAMRIRTEIPDKGLGSVLVTEPTPFSGCSEPVGKRAWCFQEQLLSCRVLEYGTGQLRWICPNKTLGEGGIENPQSPGHDAFAALRRLEGVDSQNVDTRRKTWQDILHFYNLRQLTHRSDRLRALAGVAEYYGRIFKLSYVAGLWKEDLCYQLLWYTTIPTKRSEYYAPTWSWASVDGPLELGHPPDDRVAFSIIHCSVQLTNPLLAYDAVDSGILVLRGQVKVVECVVDSSEIIFDRDGRRVTSSTAIGPRERSIDEGTYKYFRGSYHPDCSFERPLAGRMAPDRLWCMKASHASQKGDITCFMFSSKDNGATFQRKGLFMMNGNSLLSTTECGAPTDFFIGATTMTITIN